MLWIPISRAQRVSSSRFPGRGPPLLAAVAAATAPVIVVILVILLAPGAPGGTVEVREEGAEDEWFKVWVGDKVVGSLNLAADPREDGGWVVRAHQKLRVKRVETAIDIEAFVRTEEDAQGRLTALRVEQKLSSQRLETTGTVAGGVLRLTQNTAGETRPLGEIPVPPDAVGMHRADEMVRERIRAGAKPGDKIEATVFSPEINRFDKLTTTVGEEDAITVGGERRRALRLSLEQEGLRGLVISQWVDEGGRLLKFSMPVLGLELVFLRSTRSEVLAERVESPPELFLASSVPVARRVPAATEEAVYRLAFKTEETARAARESLAAGTGQTLLKEEGPRTLVLRVRRVVPATATARPGRAADGAVEFLEASTFIQSDDPAIARIARRETEGEADAWKAARLLERWVQRNVTTKSLEIGFASAKEVLERREGDCTEHAVLLAALARARGIPSRVVAGLTYHDGAFVGHMWTEVHVGEWVPLDATLGRGSVGADHIALSSSSLSSLSMAEIFLDLIQVLGNLKIEVLEAR
jgi:hypothetical protein